MTPSLSLSRSIRVCNSSVKLPNSTLLSLAPQIHHTLKLSLPLPLVETMAVKLITISSSPYGMRAALALQIKGVNYEKVIENLSDKSPLLLESNPVYKKIPVLIHDGKPICESAIIVQYIDEAWPSKDGKDIMPKDPYDRATARFWGDFFDKKIFATAGTLSRTVGEEHEAAKRDLKDSFKTLEHALTTTLKAKPYFGGQHPGYVDILASPIVTWYPCFEAIGAFKLFTEEEFPCLSAWMKAINESPLRECLGDSENLLEDVLLRRKMFIGQAK